MVEPHVIVDKWDCPELQVVLDCKESDRVLEDCGIQIVGSCEGETREPDRDDNRDGSHVQKALGRCWKSRGLIYPGNDPERIMLDFKMEIQWEGSKRRGKEGAAERSNCSGKIRTAVQQLRGGSGVGNSEDKREGREWERSMEFHMIKTTLLILGFSLLCATVLVVLGILSTCQMTLDLQEQVVMWGTPIVMRVKFCKCHRK